MFDNPFAPDLGFQRRGCSCGQHESEFAHEKLTALDASRQARRRFIAEGFRSLFRPADRQVGGRRLPAPDRCEDRGSTLLSSPAAAQQPGRGSGAGVRRLDPLPSFAPAGDDNGGRVRNDPCTPAPEAG